MDEPLRLWLIAGAAAVDAVWFFCAWSRAGVTRGSWFWRSAVAVIVAVQAAWLVGWLGWPELARRPGGPALDIANAVWHAVIAPVGIAGGLVAWIRTGRWAGGERA